MLYIIAFKLKSSLCFGSIRIRYLIECFDNKTIELFHNFSQCWSNFTRGLTAHMWLYNECHIFIIFTTSLIRCGKTMPHICHFYPDNHWWLFYHPAYIFDIFNLITIGYCFTIQNTFLLFLPEVGAGVGQRPFGNDVFAGMSITLKWILESFLRIKLIVFFS